MRIVDACQLEPAIQFGRKPNSREVHSSATSTPESKRKSLNAMQFSAEKSKLSEDAPEFDFEGTGAEVKARMEAVRTYFLENLSPQNRRLLSNELFNMDGGLRTSK